MFIVPLKERISSVEFCQDAAERPNVNFMSVGKSENDLRRSVEPRLDVGEDLLTELDAGAEICHFYFVSFTVNCENILWLQIAVNNLSVLKEKQGWQNL